MDSRPLRKDFSVSCKIVLLSDSVYNFSSRLILLNSTRL